LLSLKCTQKAKKEREFSRRDARLPQISIFENYSKHAIGARLKSLSDLLDQHPEIQTLVVKDLVAESTSNVGRCGLSDKSIFRCL
jgi:IS5 family transposase